MKKLEKRITAAMDRCRKSIDILESENQKNKTDILNRYIGRINAFQAVLLAIQDNDYEMLDCFAWELED